MLRGDGSAHIQGSRDPRSAHWGFVVLGLAFLGVTNRWLPWSQAITYAHAADVFWYQQISAAAPGVPLGPISHHHAQRFAVHYLTGVLGWLTGMRLATAYRIVWGCLTLFIVLAADRLLSRLGVGPAVYRVSMAAFLLNPYSLRYYALAFGMLQDVAFIAGTFLLLLGLIDGSLPRLLAGAVVASLGRQTSVMLIPGLVLWMAAGDPWLRLSVRRRVGSIAAVCGLVALVFLGTDRVVAGYSGPSHNLDHVLGLLRWLRSARFTPAELVELLARTMVPFAMPLALAVGLGDVRTLRAREAAACSLMAAAIGAQPVLAGPTLTGPNAARLSALGFAFVLFLLARSLAGSRTVDTRRLLPVVLAILAVSSLHHMYTTIGPPDAVRFAGLQLALATTVIVLGRLTRQPPARPPAGAIAADGVGGP